MKKITLDEAKKLIRHIELIFGYDIKIKTTSLKSGDYLGRWRGIDYYIL